MSTRITDLPQAEVLNGSEIMPLVQNGVTKKATLDFINLATPAGLILQQTQQVYEDTVDVKEATDAVLVETQSVLADTQNVLGQTVIVRNQTEAVKLDFETQYLGPHATSPTLNNAGDPLENGALYWDTTLMAMFVWDGATWTAFSSAVASVNGFIGEVVLGFADVGAAGPGANSNITSLSGVTGEIATAAGLQLDTTTPAATAVGKLTWNVDDSTLDVGVSAGGSVLQVGQEVYYRVKNGTPNPIADGSLVRLTGTLGNSGQLLVEMTIADGTHPSQTFLGITTELLAPGASGFATYFGKVRGIDTTGTPVGEAWADGDILYASTTLTGGLTKVVPEAPNNKVMVALVVHAHPNGVLFVRPTYGSNLGNDELVQLDTLTDGDVLQYDATDGRFENRSLTDAGIEPLGAAAASMVAHLADPDPHPQYTTTAEASAAAPVQSVAGKTGAVALAKADVGLSNVTNDAQLKAASNLSDLANASTARTNLGLGTAATANVTTSATDTTAGRLLKVGDFGLGGAAVALVDLNDAAGLEVINITDTTVNRAESWGVAINAGTGAHRLQLQKGNAGDKLFFRGSTSAGGGTWPTPWRELYHSGSTFNAATATKLQTARTINGVSFDGQASITVADATKLPLSGGSMTGSLSWANINTSSWARGLEARLADTTLKAGIGFLGNGDSVTNAYIGVGLSPWASTPGINVSESGITILGTVSGTAVTQSATDTTAGRLLKVGDFGVGAIGATPLVTCDSGKVTGFYQIDGSTAGTPLGAEGGTLLVGRHATTFISQLVIGADTKRCFVRTGSGDTTVWSGWTQLYSQGSILGTVSQSSGVPTGAVIERGSNASGDYVRFADGTQICTFLVPSFSTTADTTWVFPVAFAISSNSIYLFGGTNGSGTTTTYILGIGNPSLTEVPLRNFAITVGGSTTRNNAGSRVCAIGRWF